MILTSVAFVTKVGPYCTGVGYYAWLGLWIWMDWSPYRGDMGIVRQRNSINSIDSSRDILVDIIE